jgi:murein DD-endopeptidase MepM/ murein hydrolase activator NlpD
VIFLGGRGTRDDRRARPQTASPHRVIVTVPTSARSGRLRVVAAAAAASGPRLQVLPGALPSPVPVPGLPWAFPVQGAHDFGTAVNGFGGGRGHEGQDILAACRLPIVAALPGTVTLIRFQARAGNYVVIKAVDGTSQAYMHLLAPATVTKGQVVAAGQPLGQVGKTGDASACHLHFELWTAPGWYEGGAAIDPLPFLRLVDTPA